MDDNDKAQLLLRAMQTEKGLDAILYSILKAKGLPREDFESFHTRLQEERRIKEEEKLRDLECAHNQGRAPGE